MRNVILILCCIPFCACSQQAAWIKKPQNEWPQIAMINEVWYKDGERYIDPSFEYAATGFLIDMGTDTLAATAKHVLWIAKAKSMNSVHLQNKLERWIMHPKGNLKDSVVIGELINEDSTEALNGPKSTITQRDWIVFTTQHISPNIQPLKPRFTPVETGEKIWYFGCPYNDRDCGIETGEVVEIQGNKIIFTKREGTNIGGASGSPIVDENGFLIGILGGISMVKETGESALYGTSTHYLKKILSHEQPLNVPLISIGPVLREEIMANGIDTGINRFYELKKDKSNDFIYEFSPEIINALGDEFIEENKADWAIRIYQLSKEYFALPRTYSLLAKAYLIQGEKELAKEAYNQGLHFWPQDKQLLEGLDDLENPD